MLKHIFKDKLFNKKLLAITLPISMQNLMHALVAAADAIMLGKLNQNAMAAVSLATQIQFIQNVLLAAIVFGVGILGAQYWGKKDINVLSEIFGISIRESMIISIIFFTGCRFFPEALMKIFASDPTLINIGVEYLKIASWSYIIAGISQCYLAIMRVSDKAVPSAWISSGAVILNIIFNAVFIFGLCGIPAMGVKGAALATLLARIIELFFCIGFSLRKEFIRLRIKTVFAFNRQLVADFWRYTLPIVGSFMLWGTGFAGYTAILGHMGKDAAAANAIAAVVRDLMCCLCNGIAVGSSIIIGNALGAGNLNKGKIFGIKAAYISFLTGFLNTIVILSIIPLVAWYVKLTPKAYEYMVGMFVILAFYMIGRCVCTVIINGVFSAGGDTVFDVYSLVVCMWCIALPAAFIGAFYLKLPVLIIYGCTCLDEVGKIPWVIHHFRKYKWVKNITR